MALAAHLRRATVRPATLTARFPPHLRRASTSASAKASTGKKEGDISSVFVSLSGQAAPPLPPRFRAIKTQLLSSRASAIRASFFRLLRTLRREIPEIQSRGPSIIPEINFSDLARPGGRPDAAFVAAHRRHGVAVVRGVIPEGEASSWLAATRAYAAANPSTKAFPADSPAVYELYWSPAQVAARAHPNLLAAQKALLGLWHAGGPDRTAVPLSAAHPVAYADRLRIRAPGDAAFALGPHVDSGSCERWEPEGYGASSSSSSSSSSVAATELASSSGDGVGGTYGAIFQGNWEAYDAFDASARLDVVSDLYSGAGACTAFRMYQGWLALSHTGPGEGTLLVNPLFTRATAYYLLRPFFAPRVADPAAPGFLAEDNWDLETEVLGAVSTSLQGAYPGQCQELSQALHPHLELSKTMVSVPKVAPGDYVAWHCDTVHAVDRVHAGAEHAGVLYIPACPLTEANATYLARQRETFVQGTPSPDFPGGKGEAEHVGRPEPGQFVESGEVCDEGKRAMGMMKWDLDTAKDETERKMLQRANEILGF